MAALIDVTGLTKRYGRKRGIVDVSFQVADGEVFGFLGPNGAGKTTTMRLLMALLFPDSGSARVAGLDCWRQSIEVKRVLGYLLGEIALDPNLTGGQPGADLPLAADLAAVVDLRAIRRTARRWSAPLTRGEPASGSWCDGHSCDLALHAQGPPMTLT